MADLNQRYGATATEEGRIAASSAVNITAHASHEQQLREFGLGIDARNNEEVAAVFNVSPLHIAVTVYNPTFTVV